MEAEKKRQHWAYLAFSLVFGFVCALGRTVHDSDSLVLPLFELVWGTIGCRVFLEAMTLLSGTAPDPVSCGPRIQKRKLWTALFISMVLSYGICLLVYFPGVGMNDGLNILYYGMVTANQFPVSYVAWLNALKRIGWILGNYQIVFAIYSIFQILTVSAISSALLCWLSQKRLSRPLFRLVLFYYVCSPLLSMYAISMLKDTLFSLLLTVLCVFLYDTAETKGNLFIGKKACLLFSAVCLGLVVTRNNGAFIVLPLLIALLVIYRNIWKNILVILGALMVVIVLTTAATRHFSSEQLFQEAAAIPIQQLAACVAEDGKLTEEQLDFIDHLLPLETVRERYSPYSVDPIKWGGGFNRAFLQKNKTPFLKIWLQAMPHNIKIYTLAWLRETYWFWAPRQEGPVECYFSAENIADNTWLTNFLETNGIHDAPVLPQPINGYLRDYYAHAAFYFREGVCFWLALALVLILRFKRASRQYYLVSAPILLLWLTLMISTPIAASFRYVLIYAYFLPILTALLFVKEKQHPLHNLRQQSHDH